MNNSVIQKILIISFSCCTLAVLAFIFQQSQSYDVQFLKKHSISKIKKQNQIYKEVNDNFELLLNEKKQEKIKKDQKNANKTKSSYSDVIKPLIDNNNYQIFTTSNGIKTLLVSAPETQYYGASLTIKGVGSYQDGDQYQGMSHFVEHLVFTGSKGYPKWDLVANITMKGGVFNGLTMSNTTQYPFGFPDEKILYETLNRIVDFINNPGLSPEVLSREIFAVTSEYYLDIVDGQNKDYFIYKLLSDKKNSFNGFDIGNVDSLKKAIENPDILKEYIKRAYVPENMFLVIYTKEELANETKKNIEEIFSRIPKSKPPKVEKIPPVFLKENKGVIVKVKETSPIKEFTISFNTKMYNSYHTKSIDYILNMLRSGDQGDFCSYITSQFLSTGCNIFQNPLNRHETIVGVSIILTKKGLQNISEIIQYFFKVIQMLRSDGVSEKFYNIFKKTDKFQFDFEEQQDIFDNLTNLGLQFSWNPNKNVLFAPYDYAKYDREEIIRILDEITIENAIFIYRANEFQGQFKNSNKISDFLFFQNNYTHSSLWDLDYSVYKMDQEDMDNLENQFPVQITYESLEQQMSINLYSKLLNFTISNSTAHEPELIYSSEQGNLWFLEDTSFKLPFASQFILFDHDKGIQGPKEQFYLHLTSLIFNFLTGYGGFSPTFRGLQFICYVPSDFLLQISMVVLSKYKSVIINEGELLDFILEYLKNAYLSGLENYSLQEGIIYLMKSIKPNVFSVQELIQELEAFNFSDFYTWFTDYQQKTHLEVLILGNIDKAQASTLYKNTIEQLDFQAIQDFGPRQDIYKIEQVNTLIRYQTEYDHYNQCIVNIYRLPTNITKEQALIVNFFDVYFKAYSFQFLRSIHQLGYIAQAAIIPMNDVYHLVVYVEGYRKSVVDMDQRIEELFDYVYNLIKDSTQKTFNLKEYDFDQKNEKQEFLYYSLSQELTTVWEAIVSETYFPSVQSIRQKKPTKPVVQPIDSISKTDVLKLYEEWFKKEGNKLSVQMVNPYLYKELPNNVTTKNYSGLKNQNLFNTPMQLNLKQKFKKIEGKNAPIVNIMN